MAEIATIARPYAEGLFKAAGAQGNALAAQVQALADVAGNAQLRSFADNPKVSAEQVFDLIISVAKGDLADPAKNLLRTVIDNGRLEALPEIATQFHALVNASSGVSDATVYSAFEIAPDMLADVVVTLEKRFGRKLNAQRRGRSRADRRHPRGGRRRGAGHLDQGPSRANEGGADGLSAATSSNGEKSCN